MGNTVKRKLGVLLAAIFLSTASGYFGWIAADAVEKTEVSNEIVNEDAVLVGGMPVGIYMEMDGVMVLNTEHIKGIDGVEYEPASNLVKCGDYIIGINGINVDNKQQLLESLKNLDGEDIILSIRRNQELLDVKLKPVEYEIGKYRLGIWVRDNVQGLGTITFLTKNSEFGALGHGIHDMDTNTLLSIAKGSLYKTNIHSIKKGENGNPGSMEGIIVYNEYNQIGTVEKNTDAGIYGSIDKIEELFVEQIPVQIAGKQEIEKGPATIRCYIDNQVQEYDVQIIEVDYSEKEVNKGIVMQVTDPELVDKTGGIIQGMSGSPILQNGKLIGAITHVFVQDSTKGYGIFIENMLKNVG